jgi:hypothetical protein
MTAADRSRHFTVVVTDRVFPGMVLTGGQPDCPVRP